MKRHLLGVAIALVCAIAATPASARHHHKKVHHHRVQLATVTPMAACDDRYPQNCGVSQPVRQGRQTRSASSRHRHEGAGSYVGRASMVTVSTAAGIKITVHPAYAAKFQALIAELVAEGHKPRAIGCYALGHKAGSNHAIGAACDIDQTGWGRTSGFMYHAGGAIRANGLYDGCAFGDCGHVEAMRGLFNHPPNLYAAVTKFKALHQE